MIDSPSWLMLGVDITQLCAGFQSSLSRPHGGFRRAAPNCRIIFGPTSNCEVHNAYFELRMRGIASSICSLNPDFRVRPDSSPVDRGRSAGDSDASGDALGIFRGTFWHCPPTICCICFMCHRFALPELSSTTDSDSALKPSRAEPDSAQMRVFGRECG